jgi:hypothetical protein
MSIEIGGSKMSTKHTKTIRPSDVDLKRNPGIGQSKGLNRREGDEPISGENTEEGDVANDVNRFGGIAPNQQGRTNK